MPFVMETLVEEIRVSRNGKPRRVRYWRRITSGEDYVFKRKESAALTLKVLCGGNPGNTRVVEIKEEAGMPILEAGRIGQTK